MASRNPKRLAGPAQLAASTAAIYTAPNPSSLPSNMVVKALIRHIHLYNSDTVARAVTLAIGTGATAANRLLDAYSLAAGSALDLYPYYVLEANEALHGFADAASKVDYVVNGDEIIV